MDSAFKDLKNTWVKGHSNREGIWAGGFIRRMVEHSFMKGHHLLEITIERQVRKGLFRCNKYHILNYGLGLEQ